MALTRGTDAELVARCREGDQAAWAELVEGFSGYVYAILSRGFRMSDHAAEDVFQEVFARLYEKLDTVRSDAAIRPWIAQTTRRLAIDRYRASSRETVGDPPETVELDEQLERLDEALTVRGALGRLPESCREVLTRFFIHDESYETIAEATGLASGTIGSRISRCLAKLRTELEGKDESAGPSRSSE